VYATAIVNPIEKGNGGGYPRRNTVDHRSPCVDDLRQLHVDCELHVCVVRLHLVACIEDPAFGRVHASLRPQIVGLVRNVVTQLHLQRWTEQLAITHRRR